MAVKRDYGSFSKACERLFAPMVAPLGFVPWRGVTFIRPRGPWNDTLVLQQSQWGGGDFCVNGGIWVPGLSRLWGREEAVPSLLVSSRLSERGMDEGDCWKEARDKVELTASLGQFARHLEAARPWFERFASLGDIAREYGRTRGLTEPGECDPMQDLAATNHGFLLALAGARDEALGWLKAAEGLMTRIVRPTPDELARHDAVRKALAELGCEVPVLAAGSPAAETPGARKPKVVRARFPSDSNRHADALLLEAGFGKIGPKSYLRVRDGVACNVSFQGVKKDLHAWIVFAPITLPELSLGMGYRGSTGRMPPKGIVLDATDEASFEAVTRELAAHVAGELPVKLRELGSLEHLARRYEHPFGRAFAQLALGRLDAARQALDAATAMGSLEAKRAEPFRLAEGDELKRRVAREIHRNVVRHGMHKLPEAAPHLTVPLLAGWPGDWKTWT